MANELIDGKTLRSGFSDYPPVLTAAQVADLLAMNVQEVRRLARDGRIPARRLGKAYRFFRDEIVAWLDSSVAD